MPRWIAIAAYQCRVTNVPTGSVDIQVRYVTAPAPLDVATALRDEPVQRYANSDGDEVSWPLVEIFSIEALRIAQSGDELAGFIADPDELAALAKMDAVTRFRERTSSVLD